MGFTFSARTLLELGKELISSDEVALYELIKNSIDAGSPRVDIMVNVQFCYSDYQEARASIIEDEQNRPDVIQFIKKKLIDPESPDSITLLERLRKFRQREAFLDELKRLYDQLNYIEIQDTGHGMSLKELSDIFLRVGTHSRRNDNVVGAKYLGDKGIGRLSAMRLGDRLQVKTCKREDRYWNLLDIDWGLFSHDDDVDVNTIVIEPEIGDEKDKIDSHGTTIRISGLQGDWDSIRFTDVLQGRIARMVDPFIPGLANRLIRARHNGSRVQIPSIPQELLRNAHAVCHVEFRMEKQTPILEGKIDYRYRQRKRRIDAKGAEVYSLAQEAIKRRAKRGHAAFRLVPVRPSAFKNLGNFSCDIYWFNRRVISAIEGFTSKPTETRREIANWSGGPMLYRYGYRILPYGDPKDDWLALDELAFGVGGFKLNRQQVIGRVLIETPHTVLSEQTNRQGLIDSDTFNALQKILLWVVHTELRGLINEADEIERLERREAEQDTELFSKAHKRVETALARLRKRVGQTAVKDFDNLSKSVTVLMAQSESLIRRIENVIAEADEEREKFIYLAGIGLMTEFIFHELERAVSYTMDVISRGGVQRNTIESLREQLKTLHKRIAAFDELTSEKRQSKTSFNLADLVQDILQNHAREFGRHGIVVHFERTTDPCKIKAVRGMVIQILENLIVNAAYWLKKQKRYELKFEPSLTVSIDADYQRLTVEDNGPGVIEERREVIFQPFITTKPTGQGRGLGLYIAREMAEYHGWKLFMDDEIGRIRDGRINMFVLDLG
ncbi:MAG: sensor histidine kinase [Gammaproteobacteria bacterium]|nr:sensor histidine kinase [Gammaproteobacteria bacterium]